MLKHTKYIHASVLYACNLLIYMALWIVAGGGVNANVAALCCNEMDDLYVAYVPHIHNNAAKLQYFFHICKYR